MQTRSRRVEMPSGLSLPLAFGMTAKDDPRVMSVPEPSVDFEDFGADSLNFKALCVHLRPHQREAKLSAQKKSAGLPNCASGRFPLLRKGTLAFRSVSRSSLFQTVARGEA